MAQLTFWGATGTVTGSRYMLELPGANVLIDCGLFQGAKSNRVRNWESFPYPPDKINTVLLTHAHIDHTGYLPRLCKNGFSGPIYCTWATRDLCEILLKDSAHLQEEEAYWANKKGTSKHKPALPLYTIEDVETVVKQLTPLYYEDDLHLNDQFRAKFRDAGHILGSAFIDIKTRRGQPSRKILFSGDLGRPDKAILNDPIQVYNVDYLIIESTYGSRLHNDGSPNEELARVINESIERGGVLVVPSFAVGRAQTLLYEIRELEEKGKIPILPIYVDSPMAGDATKVFENYLADLDMTSRVLTLQGKKVFHPQELHLCRTRPQSKQINEIPDRAVIISTNGMANGGRILHHLQQRLPDPKNTILFTGYQAEGTRGRAIIEGEPSVKIYGEHVQVRAKVEMISGFSGHADYNESLAWLMGFNRPPEKTFIVHGETESSQALAEKIRKQFGWEVVVPGLGEAFDLNL